MQVFNENIRKLMVISKNQRADFKNVRFEILFNEDSKTYDFYIVSPEVSIYIRNIKILRSEIVIRSGENVHYTKGYFNGKAFEFYLWI